MVSKLYKKSPDFKTPTALITVQWKCISVYPLLSHNKEIAAKCLVFPRRVLLRIWTFWHPRKSTSFIYLPLLSFIWSKLITASLFFISFSCLPPNPGADRDESLLVPCWVACVVMSANETGLL
jgi:hypothetical protein